MSQNSQCPSNSQCPRNTQGPRNGQCPSNGIRPWRCTLPGERSKANAPFFVCIYPERYNVISASRFSKYKVSPPNNTYVKLPIRLCQHTFVFYKDHFFTPHSVYSSQRAEEFLRKSTHGSAVFASLCCFLIQHDLCLHPGDLCHRCVFLFLAAVDFISTTILRFFPSGAECLHLPTQPSESPTQNCGAVREVDARDTLESSLPQSLWASKC